MMRLGFTTAFPAAIAMVALAGAATAQTLDLPGLPAVSHPQSEARLSPQELDRLLAQIALFPDPLLTNILAASTYPAQIVEAARFTAAHAGLQGAALTDAAAGQDWDASIQALLPFPAVLHMLDNDLQWTDRLGHAVAAQQADVLDAVQRLRLDAQRAGTLQNGPDATVINEGQDISILPPSPQSVYVPGYNAGCVYGVDYDSGSHSCDGADDGIAWNTAILLPFGFRQWATMDWRRRAIRYDREAGERDAHDGEGDGAFWRHSAPGHGGAAGTGHFRYAPPANAPIQAGFAGRPMPAEHFYAGNRIVAAMRDGGRPRAQPAPAIHGAGGAHGGGFGGGGGHR